MAPDGGVVPSRGVSERWAFRMAPSAALRQWGQVVNAGSGQCLTAPRTGRGSNGTKPVVMQPCRGWCNQSWSLGPGPATVVSAAPRPTPRPRILCWVLTHAAKMASRGAVINGTWGRRCDRLLFMLDREVEGFPAVALDLYGRPEGRDVLWLKSKQAWLHVHRHHRDEADWFIKADDDTYVVVDNLRRYLADLDPAVPLHLGRRFIPNGMGQGYLSGGSGIVVSRGGLDRIGAAFKSGDDERWPKAGRERGGVGPEDLYTSRALIGIGVPIANAVDAERRQLFLPLGVDSEYFAPKRDERNWFYKYSKEAKAGPECCSERWVATHYTPLDKMLVMDQIETERCHAHPGWWPHLRL